MENSGKTNVLNHAELLQEVIIISRHLYFVGKVGVLSLILSAAQARCLAALRDHMQSQGSNQG